MEGNAGIPNPSKRKREQTSGGKEDDREQLDTSRLRRHVEQHHSERLPEDDDVEQEVRTAAGEGIGDEGSEEEDVWKDFDKDMLRRHIEECHPERLPAKEKVPSAGIKGTSAVDDLYKQLPGREVLVRLAVAESLPILFKESKLFQQFVQTMNPSCPRFSARALRKAAMAYYAEETESLLRILRDLKVRVSVTSGLWSSSDRSIEGIVYLYLSCHWIDEQWEMQSRVLGFLQLEWPMEDAENLSSMILKVVSKWELESKILTFNFDHMTNVSAVVSNLQASSNHGQLFHSKCAHHIVNSCLEHGFSAISSLVDKVRNTIRFIQEVPSIEQQVKDMSRQTGLLYNRLMCDVPMWSNTTYEMVDSFTRYRAILTEIGSHQLAAGNYSGTLLKEHEWSVLCSLRDLLESFKSASDTLCSVYIPTANLVIPMLYSLSEALARYRNDNNVGQICAATMESKLSAYWSDGFPMVYCLATILDPRYKLDGLFHMLDAYHANMKLPTIAGTKTQIKELFYSTYDAYFKQHCPPIPKDLVRAGSSSSSNITRSAVRLVHSSRRGDTKAPRSEIEYYLSSDDLSILGMGEDEDDDDIDKLDMLDVLRWWKHNQARYPVLANMAGEVLAQVASAKVPEDAFGFRSAAGVNEVGSKAAEMSVCLKDWIRAELREQSLFVDVCGGGDGSSDEEEENGGGDD